MAEQGSCLYAIGRDLKALETLALSFENKAGKIIPMVVDQKIDAEAEQFVSKVISEQKKVDLLVNCAYGGLPKLVPWLGSSFWETPIDVFDSSIDVGVRSAFVMSSLVVPHMIKKGSGLIIQISSFGGYEYCFDVGYGVGKAAMDRLSIDMAVELKPHGIHTISLWPGAGVTERANFPGGETTFYRTWSGGTSKQRKPIRVR